jgi:hypothetical protein
MEDAEGFREGPRRDIRVLKTSNKAEATIEA